MNKSILFVATLTLLFASSAFSCELKMGFRTTERLPLIAKAPLNDGLYYDLYSQAAQQIGCQLTVVRSPKKRLLKMLQDGEIDIYPGFIFNMERADYVLFLESGLPGGEIGISRNDLKEITNKHQLSGLTLVQSLGAPDFASGVENISYYTKAELSIPEAIELIRKKRGDFYIYPRGTLLYYLKLHNAKDIKVHLNCCGGATPLYLAFSKKSKHLNEGINPRFVPDEPLSASNWPTQPLKGTVAYQFQQQLLLMKESGETIELYNQYY
ncbi:substrate-binding periplasmic protein [Vibrio sp. TRT 17S01]|uniref:substrate-binding periplasmic protein n=1 Tax=Vibrio sp. TRT 17S01 TaxID=3418505 RepID=UPI003CF2291E